MSTSSESTASGASSAALPGDSSSVSHPQGSAVSGEKRKMHSQHPQRQSKQDSKRQRIQELQNLHRGTTTSCPCPLCKTQGAHFFHYGHESDRFFYKCVKCSLIFVLPSSYLSPDEEKRRYAAHQNDATDAGYLRFLSKLTDPLTVLLNATPTTEPLSEKPLTTAAVLSGASAFTSTSTAGNSESKTEMEVTSDNNTTQINADNEENKGNLPIGLDFGCGPGPAISVLMARAGYDMVNFDPNFFPDPVVPSSVLTRSSSSSRRDEEGARASGGDAGDAAATAVVNDGNGSVAVNSRTAGGDDAGMVNAYGDEKVTRERDLLVHALELQGVPPPTPTPPPPPSSSSSESSSTTTTSSPSTTSSSTSASTAPSTAGALHKDAASATPTYSSGSSSFTPSTSSTTLNPSSSSSTPPPPAAAAATASAAAPKTLPKCLSECTYRYVTCTEVIEHVKDPFAVLQLLHSVVAPGGVLALMTGVVEDESKFPSWHYHRDLTHIIFFHADTMKYIETLYPWKLHRPHKDVAFFFKAAAGTNASTTTKEE